MSTYDDLTFSPVLLGDLFLFRRGRVGVRSEAGGTPYIGAAARNNSMVGLLDDSPEFPGGWLAIVNNGDGGAGYCTFQPAPFSASADVTVLEPRFEASDAAKIVLASAITFQCFPKYTFGYKPNIHRLTRQKIMLPATTDESNDHVVDWEGMTRLGEELLTKAITHTHSASTSDEFDTDADLPELRFEQMFITDVFETMRAAGRWFDQSKAKRSGTPSVPYVARSGGRNGIGSYLPHQGFDAPNPGNSITIGVSTSTVFYQPVDFYTSKEIQVLRHASLDEHSGQMLVAILREQMYKFAWGNGASLDRLKATRIMVPVTTDDSGEQVVDWEGMTRYGRILRARTERGMTQATVNLGMMLHK